MRATNSVLVVGDRSPESAALQESLSGESFEVQVVGSPAAALLRIRQRLFDVLVTSPASSVGEDLDLVHELRGIRFPPRAIILAREGDSEDVIASIRAHVFACFREPLDVTAIVAMVRRAAEAENWRDGISVVSSSPHWLAVQVAAQRLTAERLIAFMEDLLSGTQEPQFEGLALAFREILLNSIEHGAGFDPNKRVEVSAVRTARALLFHFRDPGPGFDLENLPHAAVSNRPDEPLAHVEYRDAQGMRPGGFGILMTRQLVDEVIYNESGNEVLLIQHLPGRGTAEQA